MLKLPLKFSEQWQNPRAKQPSSPAAKANTYGQSHKAHTTESWRVQVIQGILQAEDNNILSPSCQIQDSSGYVDSESKFQQIPASAAPPGSASLCQVPAVSSPVRWHSFSTGTTLE